MSVCVSGFLAGMGVVLIKYTGKYVKIYFNMKITFQYTYLNDFYSPSRPPHSAIQKIEEFQWVKGCDGWVIAGGDR